MYGKMNNKNVIVILAGGTGERYGDIKPKQYMEIMGKEVLAYSIDEMKKSNNADSILLVVNNDKYEMKRIRENYNVEVVEGGCDRAHSFQNALDYINKNMPKCEKVLFHEAARPLIKCSIVDRYFDLLDEYDYVESCQQITDSLGSYIVRAPRREDYFLIQAPEAYKLSVLNQYYNCESPVYFAANQFPEFIKGYQYFGIEHNIKLTTPADKLLIEYIMTAEEAI